MLILEPWAANLYHLTCCIVDDNRLASLRVYIPSSPIPWIWLVGCWNLFTSANCLFDSFVGPITPRHLTFYLVREVLSCFSSFRGPRCRARPFTGCTRR